MKLLASGATHPGRVRVRNEDAFHVGPGLYVVADGMGGEAGGGVASELACATVAARYEADALAGLSVAARLCRAVEAANEAVNDARGGTNMGTTVAALAVDPASRFGVARGAVAWVGDSRCGLLRDGSFRWLTKDHSAAEEQRERDRLAGVKPGRYKGIQHMLTRALGRRGVKVDVEEVDVRVGDVFLLCSDGVWGELEDSSSESAFSAQSMLGLSLRERGALGPIDPEKAAQSLVSLALEWGGRDNCTAVALVSLALEWGGRDNCTAVVVRVEA